MHDRVRVCFIGGARYPEPLESETEKKFRLLSSLGDIFVVGFSEKGSFSRFTQWAHFYLLPKLSRAVCRYLVMFIVGPVVVVYLVLRHSIEILIAQSPYEGGVAACVKLAVRLCGRRLAVVIESHGDFEVALFMQRDVRSARFYRFLMRRVARFSLRHADLLRAVSSVTRNQLQAYAPDKPVVAFPAWSDLDTFFAAKASCRAGHPVVLYAGVLTPLKGVHVLAEAFSRLAPEFPEARLLIVGEAQDAGYERRLKTSLSDGQLAGRVTFEGRLPQKELASRMADACVLVLPSRSEGLGRVVFEAMACGIPVIGTRVGGIPDLVRDGVNGFLVEPDDSDALAARLRWVLANRLGRQEMGREARRLARDFFSVEKYRDGYREVFQLARDAVHGRAADRAR